MKYLLMKLLEWHTKNFWSVGSSDMLKIFRNREEAGQLLAKKLMHYQHCKDVVVLALPRGGVPVGFQIAQALEVPLDVFLVRKLGVPWQEELAVGAIAMGGVQVFNKEIMQELSISSGILESVIAKETAILEQRNQKYRQGRNIYDLNTKNRTVILVDDGIATGATIRAAILTILKLGCSRLVVATPVAPPEVIEKLTGEVDEVVCLEMPQQFYAIGNWYENFSQTTDEEVCDLLSKASK